MGLVKAKGGEGKGEMRIGYRYAYAGRKGEVGKA